MRIILSTLLLTLLAVAGRGSSENPKPGVPVVKVALGEHALKQLTSASPSVVCKTSAPVTSLESGLPHARGVSRFPIAAMSESKGWFVYATSVGRDVNGRAVFFISGYAIKRGGRQLIYWSVW